MYYRTPNYGIQLCVIKQQIRIKQKSYSVYFRIDFVHLYIFNENKTFKFVY